MRLRVLILTGLSAFTLWSTLPLLAGATSDPERLQRQIDRGRAAIDDRRQRESGLSTDIAALSARVDDAAARLATLQERQATAQAALDEHVAELSIVREDLRAARARLTRLRVRLAEARELLAVRLVELYKAGRPDLITIVLDSEDLSTVLERAELLRRVSRQDTAIVDRVRAARAEATGAVDRLGELEARVSAIAEAAAARRDEIARTTAQAAERRDALAVARDERRDALALVRSSRVRLERRVARLEEESRRVQARLARSAGTPAPGAAGGSGTLSWPVGGPVTSPFGPRWGRLHAGLDIAPPEGTPIRAAADGTVAIAGPTGGYGNYTCVQHAGGLSTCYAHQSVIQTSVGARVSRGQVIGAVGNTGFSTGPHLHFETRLSGSPVDPFGYL